MDEFFDVVRFPKERIAVVIGEKGETKKNLEKKMGVKLNIDSDEAEVEIKSQDSVALFDASNVIKAIARGFNPRVALKLIKEDYILTLMNINDYIGKSKKTVARIKARVIGSEGKSRKYIENLSNTNIVVYGKTIGIIGEVEEAEAAKKAIEGLLKGSNHSTVFKILEEHRRQMKKGL